MANEFTHTGHDNEEETPLAKSILYWLAIYAVVLPVSFVLVALLVRTILMSGSSY